VPEILQKPKDLISLHTLRGSSFVLIKVTGTSSGDEQGLGMRQPELLQQSGGLLVCSVVPIWNVPTDARLAKEALRALSMPATKAHI
jgi:hypothetical protein